MLICCAKTIGLVNLAVDSVAAFYTADGKAAFLFGNRFSFAYRDSTGQRHPAPRIGVHVGERGSGVPGFSKIDQAPATKYDLCLAVPDVDERVAPG